MTRVANRGGPPTMRHVSRRVASTFDPLSIGGLVAWFDFSDLTTLFKDAARTTPTTADADAILGVTDKSGNARHLSEATNGPARKDSIQNGRTGLRFDGVNDLLTMTYTTAQPYTVLMTLVKRSAPAAGFKTAALLGSGAALHTQSTTSATNWAYYRNQASAIVTLAGTATAWHVVTIKVTSLASLTPYFDQAADTTFDPEDTVSGATSVKFGGNTGQFGDHDFGEIIWCDSALSDANRVNAEAYLKNRWGTP